MVVVWAMLIGNFTLFLKMSLGQAWDILMLGTGDSQR